jgi:DNA invertase Pin-like site-specific DNA recombinase
MAAKRAALYVRVSTPKRAAHANAETGERAYEQNPDVQRAPLVEMANRHGWVIVECYSDRATGSKESRPGLDALMADARRHKFNAVLVWRFDRFARSVKHLVNALDEFNSLKIDFLSARENLDTSTPMGKAMFAIVAAMAELERDLMRERILAGMAFADKHGTKSGKPPGRPKAVFDRGRVANLRAGGMSWSQIARELGAKQSTVRRVYAAKEVVKQ